MRDYNQWGLDRVKRDGRVVLWCMDLSKIFEWGKGSIGRGMVWNGKSPEKVTVSIDELRRDYATLQEEVRLARENGYKPSCRVENFDDGRESIYIENGNGFIRHVHKQSKLSFQMHLIDSIIDRATESSAA